MITWKTHYKIVLFENIAHNSYIWEFFRNINKEIMEQFRDRMKPLYYDPTKYGTYLEQLGIKYPTLTK
jgi:hypothetical protein